MPPARRARGGHRAAPYCRCWLPAWCTGGNDDDGGDGNDGDGTAIPDDALSPVLARLPSAADVVRAAGTCRGWARVVAKDAAVLSGGLPPSLSSLTLGFFYQGSGGTRARRRRPVSSDAAQAQPCFVPTAAAARLTGLRCPSWTALADAVMGGRELLEHARPVAARNGWLVMELQQERYTDGLKLCVCNPTRGDMVVLPPLTGADNPGGDYACALYTGHDQAPPRPLSAFFRLTIVYNRRSFTALRSFSSDTQRWSTEGRRSGPKMASHEPRELGQSIVVRGVAYWQLRQTAFAVRLDTPEPAEVPMPLTGILNLPPAWRALGVDADGKLISIDAGLMGSVDDDYEYLCVRTPKVFCASTGTGHDDDGGGSHGKWEWTMEAGMKVPCIKLKQLKVRSPFLDKVNLRWFCEKSGNLIFTLGEGTSSPGAFVLNMATEHLEKVADGVDCDSWNYLVGYEMDGAAYLASSVSHRPFRFRENNLGR